MPVWSHSPASGCENSPPSCLIVIQENKSLKKPKRKLQEMCTYSPWNTNPKDRLSNPTNDVPNPGWLAADKYPQTSIHFYCIQAAVLYFLPPLSTTHTVYLKTKIYNIDPAMSPQLFFWNSHWKQITSALPFHPPAASEQCSRWPLAPWRYHRATTDRTALENQAGVQGKESWSEGYFKGLGLGLALQ